MIIPRGADNLGEILNVYLNVLDFTMEERRNVLEQFMIYIHCFENRKVLKVPSKAALLVLIS